MANKRTYGDSCGIARGLDVIGDRWALLVARELLLGPKRFTDLREGLPGIGPDVLSARLRDLEQVGVLGRAALPPPAGSRVYELTEWGRELEPVLLALGRWGSRTVVRPDHGELSPDALVIALKTMFDPEAARDLDAGLELDLAGHTFALSVREARLDAVHGSAPAPAARIRTDPGTLAQVLWHGTPLEEAVRAGQFEIAGDRSRASRFLELFRAPAPATSGPSH
jgi:DNA-binding HxlR family transcriptional regulator